MSFQAVFLTVQTLTQLFSLTVPNLVPFFRLFDRTFNKVSTNDLKIAIFLLQVGFTGSFVPDCPLSCVSDSSNFDPAFLPDCIKFSTVFQVI